MNHLITLYYFKESTNLSSLLNMNESHTKRKIFVRYLDFSEIAESITTVVLRDQK